MNSSDPNHFFETDAVQAKRNKRAAKATNKFGNPIALKSKIVAAVVDHQSPSTIFVAESAGTVRRVDIDDPDTKTVYRGPTAPVTSVAIGGLGDGIVFAGSWDKHVWSWDIASKKLVRKYSGHADFVKAVVCTRIKTIDCLIGGGADKKIIVWDVATGQRLHTIHDAANSMLALQALVVDPVQSTSDEAYLVSASSDPHIRRWKIRSDYWEQIIDTRPDTPGQERRTLLEHETSVYKLVFEADGDEADLWTSSADGTAKCLVRMKGFTGEEVYKHGDHVRAIAVTDRWVITAGRDEDVKIWDRSSGDLYCSLQGHYDEVTDLVILPSQDGRKDRLCSVSIDGTIRTWLLNQPDLDQMVEQQTAASQNEGTRSASGGAEENTLTEDEEAELAALMEED